ncbi:MAG: SMP-30/gluconolactonase/LRE family protein [Candidatus Latescibacterota bacterium]|nr:SMP-30/gluconolactonase/LRE family protein [Candidatus Latescibacterota bacterium]
MTDHLMPTPELLLAGLHFPEGPRWRTPNSLPAGAADYCPTPGQLWFSDMLAHQVMTVDVCGNATVVAEVPEIPSGLGWWPDGRLVVISVQDGKLMAVCDGDIEEVADMKSVNGNMCNDMVVDAHGRCWIGSPAFDRPFTETKIPGPGNLPTFGDLVRVDPPDIDGHCTVTVVADRTNTANGACISIDGKTLIFAESFGFRLTAFDIEEDGSLSNRRPWADLGAPPDGICMDEEGCVWVAVPYFDYGGPGGYVRLTEGGELKQRIDSGDGYSAYACTLGGPEMRTLFMCESAVLGLDRHPGDGRIRTVEVDVPGTGSP